MQNKTFLDEIEELIHSRDKTIKYISFGWVLFYCVLALTFSACLFLIVSLSIHK